MRIRVTKRGDKYYPEISTKRNWLGFSIWEFISEPDKRASIVSFTNPEKAKNYTLKFKENHDTFEKAEVVWNGK